jgi:hypothetical protein
MATAFLRKAKNRATPMLRLALFTIFGALIGFAYHKLVGCRSGACPITANAYVSTAYGALLGLLLSR